MSKDDTKEQISLFDLTQPETSQAPAEIKTGELPALEPQARTKEESKPLAAPQPTAKKPAGRGTQGKVAAKPVSATKAAKAAPGPVPEGDVRLTANIREELHLKLKIVAATRRTTIGELIEELVEQYL
jgi:hypothetical protein